MSCFPSYPPPPGELSQSPSPASLGYHGPQHTSMPKRYLSPKAKGPLPIQRLDMVALQRELTINSPIGTSLGNLKSLKLHHTATNENLLARLLHGIERFWQQWNQYTAEIFLEELEIDHIPPPPLIQYLSSYSGLRKLLISNLHNWEPIGMDTRSAFWGEALRKHSATLEVLSIEDDHRALEYENSNDISDLRGLRDLKFSIRLPIPCDPMHKNVAEATGSILTQILKSSLSELPQLQTLTVGIPNMNFGRHAMADDSAYRAWMIKQAEGVIEQFVRAPTPRCLFLHRIKTSQGLEGGVSLECFFTYSQPVDHVLDH